MDDNRRFFEKPTFWPRLSTAILLLAFFIAFHTEWGIVWKIGLNIIRVLSNRPLLQLPSNTPNALVTLALNIFAFIIFYVLFLAWISLFVLPARGLPEHRRVFGRLCDYVLHMHGPAVFVKNGVLIARKKEKDQTDEHQNWFASLTLIDLASAIVVERGSLPPLLNKPAKATRFGEPRPSVRVLGPGIGFLDPGERIRGTIDLRKQFRKIDNVHGFTSDGIELITSVHATFTLGQAPDILIVIRLEKQGLRALKIDPDTRKITAISDLLDEADKRQIMTDVSERRLVLADDLTFDNPNANRPPFHLDEKRIIPAILSQPRNAKDGSLEKWTNLAPQVAVSIMLDELSHFSYNQLYSLDRPEQDCFLLDDFKPAFRRRVTNQGVLSYQLVEAKENVNVKIGVIFNKTNFKIWGVRELTTPRPLRDRGIKVIDAGFSDFTQVDKSIPEQRFNNWRSQYQKETELTNGKYDLEVMRIRNHARAQAQREIIHDLSQIFKMPGFTKDAIAMHIFQALESAASSPSTNRLLPRDTLEMLRNFQRMLFPDERAGNQSEPNRAPGDDAPHEEPRKKYDHQS